jgi:hypothetical protein
MITSVVSGAPVDFGSSLGAAQSKGFAGSLDPVGVALASNSVKTATQAMHQQYDRFLEAFA